MRPLLAALALSCAAPDAPPPPGAPARVEALPPERDALVDGLVGELAVSADGRRRAFARRDADRASTALVLAEATPEGWTERVLLDAHNPDRPALTPDGEAVAFVWASTGLASVWVAPFNGGDPRQLTNVGVRPGKPGRPPEGWTAPPPGPPTFDGPVLRWEGPDGPVAVGWR
jgi:hypothetical protein